MRVKWSEDLRRKLAALTPLQQTAIPRLAAARFNGRSKTSLLKGEDRVCAWSTYYSKPNGWHHQAAFREALELAEAEYRVLMLDAGLDEAVLYLKQASQVGAELLLEEIRAGRAAMAREVDTDQLSWEEYQLYMLATHGPPDVAQDAAAELAKARRHTRNRAVRATLGALDRADIKTAIKQASGSDERYREYLERLRQVESGEGE